MTFHQEKLKVFLAVIFSDSDLHYKKAHLNYGFQISRGKRKKQLALQSSLILEEKLEFLREMWIESALFLSLYNAHNTYMHILNANETALKH